MLYRLQKVVRHIAQTEVMPRFLNTPSRRKEDGSVLSEADLAAQTAFAAALPLLEDCPMLGEEMSVQEQTRLWNEHSDGLWIVDPIDGTNNFVNGLPHFAVSVALVKNGRTELGVIYNPVSGECFYAEHGKGAFLNGTPLPLRSVEKTQRIHCRRGNQIPALGQTRQPHEHPRPIRHDTQHGQQHARLVLSCQRPLRYLHPRRTKIVGLRCRRIDF